MVMIELKDICKSFGDHVVLKNFSLKINKNEFIAIIGERGRKNYYFKYDFYD